MVWETARLCTPGLSLLLLPLQFLDQGGMREAGQYHVPPAQIPQLRCREAVGRLGDPRHPALSSPYQTRFADFSDRTPMQLPPQHGPKGSAHPHPPHMEQHCYHLREKAKHKAVCIGLREYVLPHKGCKTRTFHGSHCDLESIA